MKTKRPATARRLTHIDQRGNAHMVNVGSKETTNRIAVASGEISMSSSTLRIILSGQSKKGDVIAVARIAAIQAAKKTSELIPLAHPIAITRASVEIKPSRKPPKISVTSIIETVGQTGVEMEALTATSIGLLTIYDMCKSIERTMSISDIKLVRKSGGKSGDFQLAP